MPSLERGHAHAYSARLPAHEAAIRGAPARRAARGLRKAAPQNKAGGREKNLAGSHVLQETRAREVRQYMVAFPGQAPSRRRARARLAAPQIKRRKRGLILNADSVQDEIQTRGAPSPFSGGGHSHTTQAGGHAAEPWRTNRAASRCVGPCHVPHMPQHSRQAREQRRTCPCRAWRCARPDDRL